MQLLSRSYIPFIPTSTPSNSILEAYRNGIKMIPTVISVIIFTQLVTKSLNIKGDLEKYKNIKKEKLVAVYSS